MTSTRPTPRNATKSTPRRCRRRWSNCRACRRRSSRSRKAISCATREAYGRKLDAAGVKVTTVRYDGMIHDFGLLNGLAEEPAVRSLFAQAAAELRQYLQ